MNSEERAKKVYNDCIKANTFEEWDNGGYTIYPSKQARITCRTLYNIEKNKSSWWFYK